MTIELTAVQALRLSYLIQLGKENTRQDEDDIKEVGDIVEEQINQYFEELQEALNAKLK